MAIGRELAAGVLALVLSTQTAVAAAPADPPPKPMSVAAVKDKLAVFHDRKGHYLVLVLSFDLKQSISEHVYYGDGTTFYRQAVFSGGRMTREKRLSIAVADPRAPYGKHSAFSYSDGKGAYTCQDRKTPLTRLGDSAARAMIDKARFFDRFWNRIPHALARNDRGTYYYVDRLRGRGVTGSYRGFRVFVGVRGKMKRLKMKNVVSDARGEVFITDRGRLRLVLDRKANETRATWFRGKRRKELVRVPLSSRRTVAMIYTELGVYAGQQLHRPCDDL